MAIKEIDLEGESDTVIQSIEREIRFLESSSHPNIVSFYESFLHKMKLFIVMEYCSGGTLKDLICWWDLKELYISIILWEILQGIQYLHSTGKIHRDIKPANILITDKEEVKIADFGVSAELSKTETNRESFVGTPYWMAPEMLCSKKYN